MNICIVSSAGGHLTEVLQLKESFTKRKHFFVTFKREDSKALPGKVYFVTDPKRNPIKAVKNIFQSLSIFRKEKPDVVITTGAGVAVPLCYLSKLFGSKVIYLESFCRVKEPSLTGKLLYPIADMFLVQWKSMLKHYGKKAKHVGGVF